MSRRVSRVRLLLGGGLALEVGDLAGLRGAGGDGLAAARPRRDLGDPQGLLGEEEPRIGAPEGLGDGAEVRAARWGPYFGPRTKTAGPAWRRTALLQRADQHPNEKYFGWEWRGGRSFCPWSRWWRGRRARAVEPVDPVVLVGDAVHVDTGDAADDSVSSHRFISDQWPLAMNASG